MTLREFLHAIQETPVAMAVRGDSGWEWLFPNVETLHVISLAVVFGSVLMVDLRLMGLTSRNSSVSRLSEEALPFTWVAFVCAVITGTLMFMCKAETYFYNLQFRLKFLCLLLAGINMISFQWGIYRRVGAWDAQLPPPVRARAAGGLSIILWVGVIFFGRWIGFTT